MKLHIYFSLQVESGSFKGSKILQFYIHKTASLCWYGWELDEKSVSASKLPHIFWYQFN